MKKIITAKNIASIALGLVAGVGATYAMAFTAPTTAAPGGNVAAPVNTSAVAQTKAGNFGTLGLLNSVGTITSTGGGVRTIASGLAGSISARNFRATSNAYPGYSGGPAFEIVGQPTGWMAAQKYCLTSNPSTGMPGDAGYDCVDSTTGWGGASGGLPTGTVEGSMLAWTNPTAQWYELALLRNGTVAGNTLSTGGSTSMAVNWGTGAITAATTPGATDAVKLDVNGGVRIRGNFVDQNGNTDTANIAAEKPGSVLTSLDATGTAGWTSYEDTVKVFVGKNDGGSGRYRETMWAECGKTLTFNLAGVSSTVNHGSDNWVALSGGVSCGSHLNIDRSAPLTQSPSGVPIEGANDNFSPFSTYGVPTAAGNAAPMGWFGECRWDGTNPTVDMYVWAVCIKA